MSDANFEMYAEASKAFQYGLHDVAHKIAGLVKSNAWRRYVTPTGQVVEHSSFAAFIQAAPLEGLGTDVETVKRVCRDTPYALDLVDKALQRPPSIHAGTDNIQGKAPGGTSAEAALRRLRKDRPDLHADVLAERMTAHAAMVKAGFRPRTATVRLDDPSAIARTLRRQLEPDALRTLAELLGEDQ
jgi:hypothetical protein